MKVQAFAAGRILPVTMEDSDVEINRDERRKSLLEVPPLCEGFSQELVGVGVPGAS